MNIEYPLLIGLLLALVLDLINTAARSGLQNAHLARLLRLHEQQEDKDDRSLALMGSSLRPYAGLQILQVICRFVLAALFLLLVLKGGQASFTVWAAVGLILASVVLAWLEWGVDRYVAHDPEIWVMRLGLYTQAVSILLYPFISLSMLISNERIASPEAGSFVTEDELMLLVDAGQQEGILEQEERQMIYSIFQLGDTLTREIMVPRIEMLALDIITPLPDALDALLESGYSRVPVFENRVDNVIGILYAKDLLKVWREGNGHSGDIRSLLREPYFVPEAKKVDELLAEMQRLRVHMAVVVDEYGGVAGVATLEDIVEEILGEIQDEYDEEDLPYQVVDDGSYLFRGRIDLDDFNQVMDSHLPPEEADTLSGYIYGRLGHVPVAGESVKIDDLHLIVEQVSNRRIRKVRARRISTDGKAHVEPETA